MEPYGLADTVHIHIMLAAANQINEPQWNFNEIQKIEHRGYLDADQENKP